MNDPDFFNEQIPHFYDDEYNPKYDYPPRPHTLRDALDNFKQTVEAIKKVTTILREDNFDSYTAENIVDWYYFEFNDTIMPSVHDNYYYALTMPPLRDVEYALEILEDRDITNTRHQVDQLKLQLWQLLPDFYKGHADPPRQPLSYDPEKPYPYICVAGTFKAARARKLRLWNLAIESQDKFTSLLPPDTAPPSTIDFNARGDLVINSETAYADIFSTVEKPFQDMIYFAEDVVAMHISWMSFDPEGPETSIFASNDASNQRVKVAALRDFDNSSFGGIIERNQLVQCFIEQCEIALGDQGITTWDYNQSYFGELAGMVERLKAIL